MSIIDVEIDWKLTIKGLVLSIAVTYHIYSYTKHLLIKMQNSNNYKSYIKIIAI